MIREFAWKPRCATIISVNSEVRSTLDISSWPAMMAPVPASGSLAVVNVNFAVRVRVRRHAVQVAADFLQAIRVRDLNDPQLDAGMPRSCRRHSRQ